MKWFKHDTDASVDAKLQEIIIDYGLEGYGLYWYCLELIAGNISSHNINFELEHDAKIIAHRMGSSQQKVAEMLTRFVHVGLFEFNDTSKRITCMKMAKRLDSSMSGNPQFRRVIQSINHSHDTVMTLSANSHDTVMLDKKRTDKKRKEHTGGRFTPPAYDEVLEYFTEKGLPSEAINFFEFYESKGWKVGKDKMQKWKSAASRWIRNNKKPEEQLTFMEVIL